MLDEKNKLREGPPNCFADRVFENEINKAIQLTDKAYQGYFSKLLFFNLWKIHFWFFKCSITECCSTKQWNQDFMIFKLLVISTDRELLLRYTQLSLTIQ